MTRPISYGVPGTDCALCEEVPVPEHDHLEDLTKERLVAEVRTLAHLVARNAVERRQGTDARVARSAAELGRSRLNRHRVTINGRAVEYGVSTITYEQIVHAAGTKRPKEVHTVAWSHAGRSGTVTPDGPALSLRSGMAITAIVTDNA